MALVPCSSFTVDVGSTSLRVDLPGEGTEGLRHTGRVLWPSARDIIGAVLEPRHRYIFGLRVLELGAGTAGLPGQAAALLGASAVLVTDLEENLKALEKNAAINATRTGGRVAACALEWSVNPELPMPVVEFRPDLILCADCVFHGTEAALAATLSILMERFPNAEVWVVNIVILALKNFKRELSRRGLTAARLDDASSGLTSAEDIAKVRWKIVRTTKSGETLCAA
eukprot:m.473083 g.473083  ORF g.473083 m.473083 type:complete len:227 (+) comp33719_c0_seq1:248-928(+)